jgi:tripeptidyl-peptidase-1
MVLLPQVAAIIAQLNDIRLAQGKPALGWLNPMLYATARKSPESFHDVTTGKTDGGLKAGGFPAEKGWDAATGFGTPNFPALANFVANHLD